MPRYFFDSRDNGTFIRDGEGLDLEDLDAARAEAARALADIARDVLPGATRRELAIEVSDHDREPLLRSILVFEVQRLR